ncbi:MAG: hypothetical protein HHAS10_11650 [Candidatus Altimarinota bacterium]
MPDINILTIKVIPRAKKTEFVGIMDDGSYKIRLKAIPEDGKANTELLEYLEEETGRKWEIVGGWTNTRKKVIVID